MKFNINLTWSKLMALLILIAAVYLDIENSSTSMTMYSIPFIVALIGGKQTFEHLKEKK